MTEGAPIACSLGASELRRRLSEIAEVGAGSLIERSADGDRRLLRFSSDAETRRRLEAIVAAEAKCCSFLDLSLEEQGDELVLSVGAPGDGRLIADALAATFSGKAT
jgi:hypothetical protein